MRCFDKTTKLQFRDAEEPQYVKFGTTRNNYPSHNIRFAQLELLGMDVALFFEPSIDCIVKAVLDQKWTTHKPISHVVLVGGFAASEYMFNKVHAVNVSQRQPMLKDAFNVEERPGKTSATNGNIKKRPSKRR
ncbi:hypothetical protein BJ912DRAFT_1065531 [Pholiota molesta]|nr:hypothetical protein BJ912DRAFT_1065531 [Pholiota molesta]